MTVFRTILGDVDVKKIGFTLAHEHLITRPPNSIIKGDPDLLVDDVTKPVQELTLYKNAGGRTFLEMSPRHYGRNIPVMVDASIKTGIQIVATTGYLKGDYFPKEVEQWTVTQLADFMISEVMEGMDGTGHKAGVIKGGSSHNLISELEKKVFKAAVIASKETGAPVSTHTEQGTMGVEQVEFVISQGLDPARMIVAHVDINPDYYLHRKIVNLGAYIIHDGPSKVKYGTDAQIIEIMAKLVKEGFANRMMLSCDMGRRKYWTSYGGGPGFTYIPEKFVPRLLDEEFDPNVVEMFTTKNPAEAFAIRK